MEELYVLTSTFCNVYLPSGSDSSIRESREHFSASTIPNMLVNKKESGCAGGDWNCMVRPSVVIEAAYGSPQEDQKSKDSLEKPKRSKAPLPPSST